MICIQVVVIMFLKSTQINIIVLMMMMVSLYGKLNSNWISVLVFIIWVIRQNVTIVNEFVVVETCIGVWCS